MHSVRNLLGGLAALGVMALSHTILAAEPWTPDRNQCNEQPTTIAIASCIMGRAKMWDGRLNQAWKALNEMLAGDAPRLAALKAAQLAWIKYRDANCAYYYSQDGTIRQVAAAGCQLEMTQNRAIELQQELPR